jgi:putative PIN family toxin of toxin-antitoxin system
VRIFLDTNVLASSVVARGLCNEILESVFHDHELLISAEVLAELERVLVRKIRIAQATVDDFLALLREEAELIEERQNPSVAIEDADDVAIVASAIAGRAEVFVTGDSALLQLREVDGLSIVSPRELWIRLAGLASR